jgi:hypothetical protein
VTVAARALRLDQPTWHRLSLMATPAGGGLIVLGAYLMFAFDRFGWPDFALRPTARLMLTGLYGWMALAGASWIIARFVFGFRPSLSVVLRLTGHAHLPLLLVAVLIQLVAVALNRTGLALWPALFSGAFWMPAMLISATRSATELSLRQAMVAAGVPYLAWVVVVGRPLWILLEHLL